MNHIPYYKQEKSWTCGAACMKMILESFGIKKTEKQLAKSLETNKVIGTWEFELPELAERHKLTYVVERNGTIKDLRRYLREGFRIIVCYYLLKEKTAHYSIIHDINRNYIHFLDPYFGENHKLKLDYFKRTWKSDPIHEKDKKWFIAIKR